MRKQLRALNKHQLHDFTALVKEHQSSLRAFIRSLGVRREKVDDYAQEAFLVAYKKFDEFDSDKASFPTWLKGIIRYLILNDKRKAARRFRLQDKMVSEILISDPFDDHGQYQLGVLKNCMAELDGSARDLVEKSYIGKMSSKELAELYQRKAVTIRQQLSRIRMALKRCMEKQMGEH